MEMILYEGGEVDDWGLLFEIAKTHKEMAR